MTSELPQPPDRTGPRARRGRLIALVVAVLLAAGAVAAVLLRPAAHHAVAAPPPPSPHASPTPSPSPAKQLPYPYFPAGTCLDHPQLSKGITKAEARGCDQPHDGEAIANPVLPDGLTKDSQIGQALLKACGPFVGDWTARQGGGHWYSFPIGPDLAYYQQGLRDATCVLTGSTVQGGSKLTGHLHGYQAP
ncbi:hypothetical protein P3T37_001955 [Kitasatospora sp. MAA4]|uniref:hypothetical protein n=1 Tax=Kitasatospora sp. MAA4 TaxID=3035093 RepID=UPI002475496B|nr:hypothetical protein [Kitasatospora sp. MAA4]MDH6132570.1 hypothetical protein [Kitasatospora sp. MAA4]